LEEEEEEEEEEEFLYIVDALRVGIQPPALLLPLVTEIPKYLSFTTF
jgi:hypothetical protein